MLKQEQTCGWCRKTSELNIMQQGGGVHTVCRECGSHGPYLQVSDLAKAFKTLRDENLRIKNSSKQIFESLINKNKDITPIMASLKIMR